MENLSRPPIFFIYANVFYEQQSSHFRTCIRMRDFEKKISTAHCSCQREEGTEALISFAALMGVELDDI